ADNNQHTGRGYPILGQPRRPAVDHQRSVAETPSPTRGSPHTHPVTHPTHNAPMATQPTPTPESQPRHGPETHSVQRTHRRDVRQILIQVSTFNTDPETAQNIFKQKG
ncbi:hypothetical protein LCGC14_2385370, partial [marine sediment metagenome]